MKRAQMNGRCVGREHRRPRSAPYVAGMGDAAGGAASTVVRPRSTRNHPNGSRKSEVPEGTAGRRGEVRAAEPDRLLPGPRDRRRVPDRGRFRGRCL